MLLTGVVDADKWLNLGIPGAAMFIVLIVVMLMFNQQSRSIAKLCDKIDELVTSLSNNNSRLNEVLISNDKDQKEVLRQLDDMNKEIKDMHSRVVRIDSRLYDSMHKVRKEKDEHESTSATTDL